MSNNQKNILIISIITLASGLIVLIMFCTSKTPVRYSKGFTRVIVPKMVRAVNIMVMKNKSYYLSGVTSKEVFLGNHANPFRLLKTDLALSNPRYLTIKINKKENFNIKNVGVQVDSPLFYLKDSRRPSILIGHIKNFLAYSTFVHTPFFTEAIPLSGNSIAVTSIATTGAGASDQQILAKVSNNPALISWKQTLLQPQGDSIYSTMGILRFAKQSSLVTYVYTYRNEYMVMDTNLNFLYKGKTIDRVAHIQIIPKRIGKNSYYLASPNSIVNKDAQIFGHRLYIHSNVMSSNENRDDFDAASTIDVYDIISAKYAFSFYIPKYNGKEMKTFRVSGRNLVVFYDNTFVKFVFRDNVGTILKTQTNK